MAQHSRINFKTIQYNRFPDNTSEEIEEVDFRDLSDDITDSHLNSVSDLQLMVETEAGTGNAYNVNGGISAYANKFSIIVKFHDANTGAATLNVNSVGAIPIKKAGAELVSGDIPAGQVHILVYDGTNFEIVGRTATIDGGTP